MENTGFDTKELLGTVEGKIRSIAETLGPEIEYRFMNWAQANVELDKIEKPTVIYVLPPSGTLTFRWKGTHRLLLSVLLISILKAPRMTV